MLGFHVSLPRQCLVIIIGAARTGPLLQASSTASIHEMSRSTPSLVRSGPAPTARPAFGSRPRSIDYFLMLCGFSLSILLTDLCNLQTTSTETARVFVQRLLRILPEMLFLPLG